MTDDELRAADLRRRMDLLYAAMRRRERVEQRDLFALLRENALLVPTPEGPAWHLLLVAEAQRGFDVEGAIAFVREAAEQDPNIRSRALRYERELAKSATLPSDRP